MDNKKNTFTAQPWFVLLMFFFIWTAPLGLYFMWKHTMFTKVIRQIITSLTIGTILVLLANFFFGELEVPEIKTNAPVIEKTKN
ncbi:MAG: hypothetical protein ACRCU6_07415 [Fusobacteriaceae bacterium]